MHTYGHSKSNMPPWGLSSRGHNKVKVKTYKFVCCKCKAAQTVSVECSLAVFLVAFFITRLPMVVLSACLNTPA